MSEIETPVYRTTETVRTFRFQSFCQSYFHCLTSYGRHMQVFIVCLRCTETRRPGQTSLKFIRRFPEGIDTRTKNHVIHQIVFIQTEPSQYREIIQFPFILHKSAGNLHILSQVTSVTRHHIMQGVILILQSTGKGSRRKETVVHVSYIHSSTYSGQVFGFSVCILCLVCPIIAITVGVLCRSIYRKLVLVLIEENIIRQSPAVNDVLGLFRNIRFVRLQIKLISSATEFIGGMIFQTDTAELCRTVICPQSECIHIQFAQFRESVPIRIIRITVAIRLIQRDTIRIVGRNQ